jgi:hypothetical protein
MINSLLLLRRLRKHLKLNRSQLELIQLKKLKALLHHAYENVPYYKALFDSVGIKPGEIKDVGDLHKIPTTGKIKLQSLNLEEILVGGISVDRCVVDVIFHERGLPNSVSHIYQDFYGVRIQANRSTSDCLRHKVCLRKGTLVSAPGYLQEKLHTGSDGSRETD